MAQSAKRKLCAARKGILMCDLKPGHEGHHSCTVRTWFTLSEGDTEGQMPSTKGKR